jgi:hypothetical protein
MSLGNDRFCEIRLDPPDFIWGLYVFHIFVSTGEASACYEWNKFILCGGELTVG